MKQVDTRPAGKCPHGRSGALDAPHPIGHYRQMTGGMEAVGDAVTGGVIAHKR